jgi:hypothetical protein
MILLCMSMGLGNVCKQLRPWTEPWFMPGWYMSITPRQNDSDKRQRKNSDKTCPSVILFTTNTTWIEPDTKLCLLRERPVANCLSKGKATVEWHWQGKTKNLENTYPSVILSTNPTYTDPGINSDFRAKCLVTNHLSHGAAAWRCY